MHWQKRLTLQEIRPDKLPERAARPPKPETLFGLKRLVEADGASGILDHLFRRGNSVAAIVR